MMYFIHFLNIILLSNDILLLLSNYQAIYFKTTA